MLEDGVFVLDLKESLELVQYGIHLETKVEAEIKLKGGEDVQ